MDPHCLVETVLDWKEMKHVVTSLNGLLQKYSTLFNNKFGNMKGMQTKLAVKPDAKPNFAQHKLHLTHSLKQLRKISVVHSYVKLLVT